MPEYVLTTLSDLYDLFLFLLPVALVGGFLYIIACVVDWAAPKFPEFDFQKQINRNLKAIKDQNKTEPPAARLQRLREREWTCVIFRTCV